MDIKKFRDGFTNFVTLALKPLILILVVTTIGASLKYFTKIESGFIVTALITALTVALGWVLLKKDKIKNQYKIIIVLLWGMIIRILWLINIDSIPVSDFRTIFDSAKLLAEGDPSMMHGNAYIARFPHLTMMVVYMSFMIKTFQDPLIAMKIVNLFMGVSVIFLIYLIVKEVFESKKYGLIGALIAAIFPPLVTYTSVFCTENIAIPFYLLGIYLFLLACKKKVPKYMFLLAGGALSVGHLFRMVAMVLAFAFVLYIAIYYNDTVKEKIKAILMVVISFMLVLGIASFTLKGLGITENQLWKGAEPSITNILKGTNIKHNGAWNEEDAKVPDECNYDYDAINKKAREIIIERFKTTPITDWIPFYIQKYATQWSEGDLSGIFWAQLDVPEEGIKIDFFKGGRGAFQLIYTIIMILVFIGLFNKKRYKEKPEINLFYIGFCGYGLAYLVTEMQSRYSYIVCWLFIILAISGVEKLREVYLDKKSIK